jgi:hypothetical protein
VEIHVKPTTTVFVLVAAAGLLVCSSAWAQILARPIYSTFDSATNSVAAPLGGTRTFSSFTSLARSPNGERWTLIGNFTGDTSNGRAIFTGSSNSGSLLVQRGQPIPGITTKTFNVIDNPKINDSGQFVFSTNSSGTPASPAVFFLKGSFTPTPTYEYVAAIGNPITTIPGFNYSSGFSSTLLDNAGRHGMQCSVNDGTGAIPAIIFNGQLVSKAFDAAYGPTLADNSQGQWTNYTLRRVFVDAQGSPFFWGIGPSGEDIASTGTNALVSEGYPLVAGGPNVQTFNSVWQEPSGRWFVRGTLNDSATDSQRSDFVLSQGAVLAQRGQPVITGSSMNWDRSSATSTINGFNFNVGDNAGNHVIAGFGIENGVRSAVVVLNGTSIVARAGDTIDLNANDIADDDAFILGFKQEIGPGTAFLAPGGRLSMLVTVRNGAGTNIGEAFIHKQIDVPAAFCPADFDQNGSRTIDDMFIFINAWFAMNPRADFDGMNGINIDDIFIFINAWFAGCP